MFRKIAFIIIFFFFYVCLISFKPGENHNSAFGQKKAAAVTIVYTNSLNGNIDACKCKEEPNGGLVKRATVIKSLRKKYGDIFLFETGDFFSYEPDPLLAKYLIRAYKYLRYDAISFGDQEFSMGADMFLKYGNDLPFVCNNISVKKRSWVKPYRRYRIIVKKGIKAGVIGTISKKSFRYYSKDITAKVKISDQINEIKKDAAFLKRKGVDLIILLSHSGYEADKMIQKKVPLINVIVGGHSQTFIKAPRKKGNSVIVQAGTNGARIGIIRLEIKRGRIRIISNRFMRPDRYKPKDDPQIRELINRYKKEVKENFDNLRFK